MDKPNVIKITRFDWLLQKIYSTQNEHQEISFSTSCEIEISEGRKIEFSEKRKHSNGVRHDWNLNQSRHG